MPSWLMEEVVGPARGQHGIVTPVRCLYTVLGVRPWLAPQVLPCCAQVQLASWAFEKTPGSFVFSSDAVEMVRTSPVLHPAPF